MKSRTRQVEVTGQANRMRGALNLTSHPNFGRDYGEWTPSGNPAGYFTYSHLGYEVRLRFSQETHEWTAMCSHFDIQTSFPNQPPQDIQAILNTWLMDHIERPITPDARLRSNRPAVLELANRHGISPSLALEMYEEKGF